MIFCVLCFVCLLGDGDGDVLVCVGCQNMEYEEEKTDIW